ncbi:MAG: tetratricopeptide repeat protein [Magnetococcus sp. XQGC-1]
MTEPLSGADLPAFAERLATARQHHLQGELAQAALLYEQLLLHAPRDPEILHLSGLVHLAQGDGATAVKRISLANMRCPDHPVLTTSLGLALMQLGRYDAAIERFKDAVRLKPDHAEAYCHWGHALLLQKKEQEALQPLQEAIRVNPAYAEGYALFTIALRATAAMDFLVSYYQRLTWHYTQEEPTSTRMNPTREDAPQHTFFLDRERALATARQGLRVRDTIAVSGRQICYHLGDPCPDAPDTLFSVPLEPQAFEQFFLDSRLAAPSDIAFNPAVPEERRLAEYIVTRLYNARHARMQATTRLAELCRQSQPHWLPGQPWRVYVPTSRKTTVMQYAARDLAEGFRQQGCSVLFSIESDDRESLDSYHRLREHAAFNPHITVNINNLRNDALHPDLFNVIWWQDRMAVLVAGQPLPWRERDLVYSIDKSLDGYLQQCAAPRVERQGFCYDAGIFRDEGRVRQNKVVVVASSARNYLSRRPQEGPLLTVLEQMFAEGEPLTDARLEQLAAEHAYPREDIFWNLWYYVVRNQSVRWLCALADQVDVEVYGRYWETDAQVAPFFKGELPPGAAVAAVYNEARYVLVAHQFDLQGHRLVEVAACGAIPIVYDCRYRADPPHWDEQCLWFRTQADLRASLTQTPVKPPVTLCHGRSYAEFAQRILTRIQQSITSQI